MNPMLAAWNAMDPAAAITAMISCCGASRWAQAMVDARPIATEQALLAHADALWAGMAEPDWLEAFACHPRIGDRESAHAARQSALSSDWSRQEQSATANAEAQVLAELATGNQAYEDRFGFTYIVRATGKTAPEMLAILNRRLAGDRSAELREAAEQQRQITQIRLRKWLQA